MAAPRIVGASSRLNSMSPHHLMSVKSTRHNVQVMASAPDSIEFNLSSDWEPLSNDSNNKIAVMAEQFTGTSIRNQAMSAQAWSGVSPLQFSVQMNYHAEFNAEQEVLEPFKYLSMMALPAVNGKGFFIPPGPKVRAGQAARNLFGLSSIGDSISVNIGQFIVITNLILLNVDTNISLRDMGPIGTPNKLSINVTFRTLESITYNEFLRFFV